MKCYLCLLLGCLSTFVQAQDSCDLISKGIPHIQNQALKFKHRKKCAKILVQGPRGAPGLPGLPGPTGATGNPGAQGNPGLPTALDTAYGFFFSMIDQNSDFIAANGGAIKLEGLPMISHNISTNSANTIFTVGLTGDYAITYVVNIAIAAQVQSQNYSIGLYRNGILLPNSAYSAAIGAAGTAISFYMVGQVIATLNAGDQISLVNADTLTPFSLDSIMGSYTASLYFQKL